MVGNICESAGIGDTADLTAEAVLVLSANDAHAIQKDEMKAHRKFTVVP
ncbi:hypothetical protein SAMN05216330_11490 [Bradyrhizobium sp. Ghvi]|nr:hypothetical protein [Bradyrhizobium sp. Ghvi]SFQ06372.1 hypothetical protein SAMN05216330_11490 [Bradyrhizobium sp. Ghvi]